MVAALTPSVAMTIGDHRDRDQRGRHLHDAEQQHHQGTAGRRRDAHEDEADTDQQHLDEGDADHALGHGADGGGAQFGDLRSPCSGPKMREATCTALRWPLSP